MLSFASLVWIICTLWITLGYVFVCIPSLVPAFILNLYCFGKLRNLADLPLKNVSSFMVPKSYFSHFYFGGILCCSALLGLTVYFSHFYFGGIICCSALLGLTVYVVCGDGQWPEAARTLIDMMRYPGVKESYGDVYSLLLVLACADFQVTRRFLECKLVSVYSPGQHMSFIIYLVGVLFYVALPLTALSGTDLSGTIKCGEFLQNMKFNHFVGVSLFLWASWKQNETANQFAKLRQNKSGTVENTRHHIPHGGLFEYVSCPHYFTEILIYLSFNVMFHFNNTMLVWLFVFVLSNQVVTGYLSHKWYLENFKKYPKDRKAVIPFIL